MIKRMIALLSAFFLIAAAAGAAGEKAKDKERDKKVPPTPAEQMQAFATALAGDEKRGLRKLLENDPLFFTYQRQRQ